MIEIPIRYEPRTYGETQISRFRDGLRLIKMFLVSLNLKLFKRINLFAIERLILNQSL